MTETQAEQAGFEFVKSYHHDQFYTRRFVKGVIELEFTYESETDNLVTTDITIDEVIALEVNLRELQSLDAILNKNKSDLTDVNFELPSDEIFDKPKVNLKNPLEEFYYYERPAYSEDNQKQFRSRLQKALDYLQGK